MQGENQDAADVEEFGERMQAKRDDVFRVGLQNITNLSEKKNVSKSRQIISYIVQKQFDVFMMTEVGLCWKFVALTDQWFERIFGKFRSSRSCFGYNKTELDKSKTLQPGGVGIIAVDDSSHRVTLQGRDESGLGRWAWLKLQGRQGVSTIVVTVYRPCDSNGPETVNQQHRRYLAKKKRTEEPRTALYTDLFEEITAWKLAGSQIILGIDANEDVRTGETAEFFRACGMKEAILDRHREQSPPATYNRNQSRQPIDGLWVTPGLTAVAAGYEAFGKGCPSDHRALWADFTYEDAFGHSPPPLTSPDARRLRAEDPRLADRYNEQLKAALKKRHLPERLFKVEIAATNNGWNAAYEAEYNTIQWEQLALRKGIETNIRKICNGEVPWSPKLQRYRNEIELWSMIWRKRRGVKVSNKRIRKFMKKTGIWTALRHDMEDVVKKLTAIHKDYKEAKTHAEVWRNDFLESLAAAKAKKNGTTIEKERKQLTTVSKQRKQARNIKRMRRKLGNCATTKVYTTDDNGIRRECDTKITVEDACIRENSARFSQTEGTPAMLSPLLDDLGYLADTDQAEDILHGTYVVPDGTDQYAAKLIAELRMPDSIKHGNATSQYVSTQEHVSGWKKQKEGISADPDGLTFSHYKAAAQDDYLAQFDATLRSLPYQHGFVPAAWVPTTDVEILKKAGVYDVEKMRTILLMNAEFNMNNKKLGRDTMHNAETHGTIAREQYGSRKNHRSITAALNKRLTMDVLRQRRQAGALCSNDAKSCYDRVVHNVASLSMRRQGAPKNACKCMFWTLQKAVHKIRTAFGVSTKTHGGKRDPPYQGLGQGNGCGPAGWALVSTPLINMMKTAGFGFSILTAMTLVSVAFICYAFVDDTDVVHVGRDVNTTGEEILLQMQDVVDHWEGGMKATGGALVPTKSYWYLVDFIWNGKKWVYATKDDVPGDISIRTVDGASRVDLQRYEVDHAEETLGVYLAMDGNNTAECAALRKKAEEFADCIRTGFISRDDAVVALHTTIMKSLEYPLEATTMTKKQWDYVMGPIMMASLPRMGYVRTFPRNIVYASKDYCGLGVMHPWYNQELTHLETCLREGTAQTITGDLLRASTEQMRLEMGISSRIGEVAQETKKALTLATDCWLKTAHSFATTHRLRIHDTLPLLQPYRRDDRFLIEEFIKFGFQGQDLRMLNECRMFLTVTTLAEIATADGVRIEDWAWTGTKKEHSLNQYQWPRRQTRLSPSHWSIWRTALNRSFLLTANRERQLRKPLGAIYACLQHQWRWFYSEAEERLFHREGGRWAVYSLVPSRVRRLRSKKFRKQFSFDDELPSDAAPISVSRRDNHIYISGIGAFDYEIPVSEHPSTIADALLQLPRADQWAAKSVDCSDNGRCLAMAILNGTARAISDGSFKDKMGTSASVLYGSDPSKRIMCVNAPPGHEDEQSAYRSELAGIEGTLALVASVCKVHDIRSGSITIGLDGDQALIQASGDWPLHPSQADFDMLHDIREKLKRLPITVRWKWIEGHQDDHVDYEDLDDWAKANVLVDNVAKAYWNHVLQMGESPAAKPLGDEGWAIYVSGEKVGRFQKRKLYDAISEERVMEYWAKKSNLHREAIRRIDWKLCGEAFSKLTIPKQRRVTKHASGLMACGRMMKLWGFQDHEECPRCPETREVAQHVLSCPAPSTTPIWEKSMSNLRMWMESTNTMPELQDAIITRLRQWKGLTRKNPTWPTLHGLRIAVAHQDELGWYNFLMGRISIEWKAVQQRYYEWLGKRNTGKKWAVALIQKVFSVSWDMWDHRNDVRVNTVTPAKARRILVLNQLILDEYERGSMGMIARDQHWLIKPTGTILAYDFERKEQWVESVQLARIRFHNRDDHEAATNRQQRALLAEWLA
jgi:hypothetical protein